MRHFHLGQTPGEVYLVDEAIIDWQVEGGERALQVSDHDEDGEGKREFVALHQPHSHSLDCVRLGLLHQPAWHRQSQGTPQPYPVHGLLCAVHPRHRCSSQQELLREVHLTVQIQVHCDDQVACQSHPLCLVLAGAAAFGLVFAGEAFECGRLPFNGKGLEPALIVAQ